LRAGQQAARPPAGALIDTTVQTYGADRSGLVFGYAFDAAGNGRAIDSPDAEAWLGEQGESRAEAFVWLHFNGAHSAAERWLRQHLSLDDVFFEALRDRSRTTRIESADESLVGVLNDVIYDFLFTESSEVSTVYLHVDARMMISVRRQPLRSIDRLRSAVRKGERFHSPMSLLIHLLRDQADVLVQIVRNTSNKVDGIEDGLLSDRLNLKRASLGSLRRDLVRLRRLLAPEPAALFRLLNHPPEWIGEEDAQDLRESTEEFAVVLGDIGGLQERVKLLQEEIAARVTEQTNRSVFVLTAVTVLALPINIIAGLFGMNVGGVPLAQHGHGFWIVVGMVIGFTSVAAWVVFRGRRND
jgi:zinc transporter